MKYVVMIVATISLVSFVFVSMVYFQFRKEAESIPSGLGSRKIIWIPESRAFLIPVLRPIAKVDSWLTDHEFSVFREDPVGN